tara:strand:+ start:6622 stop:9237 length:2616 start_codon:yes stop_codon:yes gene_type:complete
MEYLNKKLIKSKKKIVYSKKIKYFPLLLIIFFLGIWTERFDFKDKLKNFSYDIINTISNRVYTTFYYNTEKLTIDVNYKNYLKILSSRDKSIKAFRASEDIHQWVAANLDFNNNKYKIRLKLKGVHKEHWEDPKKWSFKVKILNDKSINGIKRFSIQQPKTRDYLYEWLFMKVLKEEGLIFHRTNFLETSLNGDNLGIYFLEEQHSKQLIENNKRREGPIIGLDKNLWIMEANNLENLTVNTLEDSFWRAKIKPVQFRDEKIGTEQELYLKNAINLFEEFRKGNSKINQTFDTIQLAKLLAIKAIFGASEFDWKDIKFYYNPITSLLEPIGREAHIDQNFNDTESWWISGNQEFVNRNNDQRKFIDLLFADKDFYKLYLSELLRLTEENYIPKIIENNNLEFKKYRKLLELNFPLTNIFSINHFIKTRDVIRNTLNPLQGLNAYYLNHQNDSIEISLQNTQRLPVEVTNIIFDNKKKLPLNKSVILKGKEHGKPVENYSVKFLCKMEKSNNICDDYLDEKDFPRENTKVSYNILGQKKEKQTSILKFYDNKQTITKKKFMDNMTNLKKFEFLEFNKKEISFVRDKISIDQRVIFPKGFTINIHPGTEINLEGNGNILSYSPLIINGRKDNPVIIRAKTFKNQEKSRFGNGISIINANSKSIIKNTHFLNLRSPDVQSGEGFLGAINIYRSEILFEDCRFIENKGEDFLNIISSDFLIKNINMKKINFDAIDFDFSNGFMENITIDGSGNDALDFSGSKVEANNIFISNAGDKGISAGEQSEIKISDIIIKKSNIGIASKDLSKVEIKNINIENSNIAAAAYQKKSEFGPGYIDLNDVKISDTLKTYLSEKNSVIKVHNKIIKETNINYAQF